MNRILRIATLSLLLGWALLVSASAVLAQEKLYWLELNRDIIQRAAIDGTAVERLFLGTAPDTLDYLSATDTIFFADIEAYQIGKVQRDGSGEGVVVQTLSPATGISIDAANQKLYWSELQRNVLMRASLDGSAIETVKTGTTIRKVVVSGTSIFYYVSNVGIFRADLDGANEVQIIPISSTLTNYGLAVDAVDQKIYYTEYSSLSSSDTLKRANLDGTAVETLLSGVPRIVSLSLSGTGQLYLAMGENGLVRVATNGTGQSTIYSDVSFASGVATVLGGSQVVFSDTVNRTLELLVVGAADTTNLRSPGLDLRSIAVDARSGKIFFSSNSTNAIGRMNFDGSSIEELFNTARPQKIAVDEIERRVYWIDESFTRIYQSRYDGSERTMIADGYSQLRGLAVAPSQFVFFSSSATNSLYAIDLTSGSILAIATGLSLPGEISVDSINERVFLREGVNSLSSFAYDGSDPVFVPTPPQILYDFTVSAELEKVYFFSTGSGSTVLQRMNYDGSDTEELLTGVLGGDIVIPAEDVAAPQSPVILSPAPGVETEDGTPIFTGQAEGDTTIEVYEGATLLGVIAVDVLGRWSFEPSVQLAPGRRLLRFISIDHAGNVSSATEFELFIRPVVQERSVFLWNRFIGLINILAISNPTAQPIDFELTVVDAVGQTRTLVSINLLPGVEKDILINDLQGVAVDSFGSVIVTASAPGAHIEGYIYRLAQDGRTELMSGLRVDKPRRGESAVLFNTIQPSAAADELAYGVYNWLQLVNLSTNVQRYQLIYYNQAGIELHRREVSVSGRARLDLQAGHEFPGPRIAGMIRIVPNGNEEYFAQVLRLGANAEPGVLPESYSYSMLEAAEAGTPGIQYVAASKGGEGENWLIVANSSAQEGNISLRLRGSNGSLLHEEQMVVRPFAQVHLLASPLIVQGVSAQAEIQSSLPLLVRSSFYFRNEQRGISAAYLTQANRVLGAKKAASYNSFMEQYNWLRVFNVTTSQQTVVINVVDSSGAVFSHQLLLAPLTAQDIGVHLLPQGLPADVYGLLTVESSQQGAVAAELVRTRYADRVVTASQAIPLQ